MLCGACVWPQGYFIWLDFQKIAESAQSHVIDSTAALFPLPLFCSAHVNTDESIGLLHQSCGSTLDLRTFLEPELAKLWPCLSSTHPHALSGECIFNINVELCLNNIQLHVQTQMKNTPQHKWFTATRGLLETLVFLSVAACSFEDWTTWRMWRMSQKKQNSICTLNCINFISLISLNLLSFCSSLSHSFCVITYILTINFCVVVIALTKYYCMFSTVIAYLLGLDINRLFEKRKWKLKLPGLLLWGQGTTAYSSSK